MNRLIQSIAAKNKKMSMHPSRPRINPESQQRFASKVLALTGVLQTTLESTELIALFSNELAGFVRIEGVAYHFPELQIEIAVGAQSSHSCRYQLLVSGESLGEIKFFRIFPFDEQELETIENLLSGLLYPLRNALLYHRAILTARIDPLTGIKNRSTLDEAVQREIKLARRQQSPLSILLLDIDHFKSVNDIHGHLFGDQALRAVAQCVQKTIRDSDLLFRYGGEEFMLLLSGTDVNGSALLAERIRQEVERMNPLVGKQINLTISLGVTNLQPEPDNMESFLERADMALYRAKQNGRNRVELA
ncbi:MAG: GGDEF domain-containing protein [Gammaproteobacteria bacterium]|nr:GGDEF domain-containing protein [Gammaproteobacteria bacterium]MCP5416436.1 GGDEF domain-containing protein [Chromatiaceae bacterium]